jgi:hypothetical protein
MLSMAMANSTTWKRWIPNRTVMRGLNADFAFCNSISFGPVSCDLYLVKPSVHFADTLMSSSKCLLAA